MKPKMMRTPTMQQVGHYRARRGFILPGQLNVPRRGRPGKMTPSFKKITPRLGRRGR